MVIVALLGTLASANTPVSKAPSTGFVLENNGLEVRIDLSRSDHPRALGSLRGPLRICPVGIWMREGALSIKAVESCHPLALGPVTTRIGDWSVVTEGRPGPDRQVGELLYVFGPDDQAARMPASLYVVPQAATKYTVTDATVQRYPLTVEAVEFPVYPDSAPRNTYRSDCDVRIEIDPYGVPVDIAVTRCDEVFVAPTIEGFGQWAFDSLDNDDLPYRVARFGTRYVKAPEKGAKIGDVTVFEPRGIRKTVADAEQAQIEVPGPDDPFADDEDSVRPVPRYRKLPKLSRTLRRSLDERVVCRFQVEIDRRGRVDAVTATRCPDLLVEPAVKAVRKWRWEPVVVDGEAQTAVTRVSVRFDPPVDP